MITRVEFNTTKTRIAALELQNKLLTQQLFVREVLLARKGIITSAEVKDVKNKIKESVGGTQRDKG